MPPLGPSVAPSGSVEGSAKVFERKRFGSKTDDSNNEKRSRLHNPHGRTNPASAKNDASLGPEFTIDISSIRDINPSQQPPRWREVVQLLIQVFNSSILQYISAVVRAIA